MLHCSQNARISYDSLVGNIHPWTINRQRERWNVNTQLSLRASAPGLNTRKVQRHRPWFRLSNRTAGKSNLCRYLQCFIRTLVVFQKICSEDIDYQIKRNSSAVIKCTITQFRIDMATSATIIERPYTHNESRQS
jgi:hypothetical protein